MPHITKNQIDTALPKIQRGYSEYLWIHENIRLCDTRFDSTFQKKFNSFYGITPFRDKKWQASFYGLLEKSKEKGDADFDTILDELHEQTGSWEGSFASKLVHSIHTDRPIIDQHVLRNLGLQQIVEISGDKKLKLVELYKSVSKGINFLLQSDTGNYLVKRFRDIYPSKNITKTKMADFVLWQIRR